MSIAMWIFVMLIAGIGAFAAGFYGAALIYKTYYAIYNKITLKNN